MGPQGIDPYHRISFDAEQHRAVLWVLVAQIAQREYVFLRLVDDLGVATDQHVREAGPIFFVMVDDESDVPVFSNIAHPLESDSGQPLRLLVDNKVEARGAVEPEANRHIM